MVYSKTFYESVGNYFTVGELIADFCNRKEMAKSNIVSCNIYPYNGRIVATLLWEEVEVD